MLGRTHGLAVSYLTWREIMRLAATNHDIRALVDELPQLWQAAVATLAKSPKRWNASKVRAAGIQRRGNNRGRVRPLTKAERLRIQRTPARAQITAHMGQHDAWDAMETAGDGLSFRTGVGCCRNCLTFTDHITWGGVCHGCFRRAGGSEATAAEATRLGVPASARADLPYRRVAKGWGFQKLYAWTSLAPLLARRGVRPRGLSQPDTDHLDWAQGCPPHSKHMPRLGPT